jgi:hypothetical protein
MFSIYCPTFLHFRGIRRWYRRFHDHFDLSYPAGMLLNTAGNFRSIAGADMSSERKQFAIVDEDNCIQAIILTRNNEFYCYEHFEDSPNSLKAAQEEYPECRLVEIQLKSPEPVTGAK